MQNSKERVLRAIEFMKPDRIPFCLNINTSDSINEEVDKGISSIFETDILTVGSNDPGFVPERPGQDEWGCIWETKGPTMGEVVENPLRDWVDFDLWQKRVPDFKKPERYLEAKQARMKNPDKFMMGGLGFVLQNLINLRGFENFLADMYLEKERLSDLIDIIYLGTFNKIDRYAEIGLDAVIAWEDWGLQDRLMMNPTLWRTLYKEKMARMIQHIHSKGMKYILHSCGNILEILDDLIEIGLDVIQMDQQKLMGLDVLQDRYCGRICFFNPVDIQYISGNSDLEGIRKYCLEMAEKLSTGSGGFMYKLYGDPHSVNAVFEAIMTECLTFREYNPYI